MLTKAQAANRAGAQALILTYGMAAAKTMVSGEALVAIDATAVSNERKERNAKVRETQLEQGRKSQRRARKEMGYESNGAKCRTCIHYKPEVVKLTTNSQTVGSDPWCLKGKFNVRPSAFCNHWENRRGETLAEEE